MSHILLSNAFFTERETKGSYCGRNCIFWSASHQLGCPPVGNPLSDVLITDKRQSIFLFQHIARIWHLRHTDTQISFRIVNNSTYNCPTFNQIWINVVSNELRFLSPFPTVSTFPTLLCLWQCEEIWVIQFCKINSLFGECVWKVGKKVDLGRKSWKLHEHQESEQEILYITPLCQIMAKRGKQVNQTKYIHSPNNVCFVHSSRLQRIFAPLRMQIETKMFVEAFQCFHVQTAGYIILCYSSYLSLITWGGTPQGVLWDWLTIYWSEKCLQNTILHQPHRS